MTAQNGDLMHTEPLTHDWMARFCVTLLKLKPQWPLEFVVQTAAQAYPYCRDLDPEMAAADCWERIDNEQRELLARGRDDEPSEPVG